MDFNCGRCRTCEGIHPHIECPVSRLEKKREAEIRVVYWRGTMASGKTGCAMTIVGGRRGTSKRMKRDITRRQAQLAIDDADREAVAARNAALHAMPRQDRLAKAK